jgi:hypothetical protein
VKEHSRLTSAVARLGAAPERRQGRGRELAAADPQNLIELVLAEIDETILARELQLRNGRGEEIRLEVSGRRLLRIAGVAPKELAKSCAASIGEPIDDANGAAAHAFAKVLGIMATGSPSFTVVSRKLPRRPGPAETGCSPEALLASWKRAEAQPRRTRPVAIPDFLARSAPYASAFIRLENGKVVQQEGEPQLLRRLADLPRTEAPGRGRSAPGQCTEDFVLLTTATEVTDEADAILYARDASQAVLILFPARFSAVMVDLWAGNA